MSSHTEHRNLRFDSVPPATTESQLPARGRSPMPAFRYPVLALLLCLLPLSATATVYTVGVGGGCTHANFVNALTAAVADASAGPHEIRIVEGSRGISNYEIVDPLQDITIIGGFSTCAASTPGAGQRTTLTANGIEGRRLLRIVNANANPRRTIVLSRLTLTGGLNPSADLGWGGALYISGHVSVVLNNETFVDSNTAVNGGGIAMLQLSSDPALATRLRLSGGSRVCENTAAGVGTNANGGGIYALGGTLITLWDGSICGNSARRYGGGIHLSGALSRMVLDPLGSELVSFVGNNAGGASFAATEGHGGAIYTSGGNIEYGSVLTSATLRSVEFIGNTANFGGAIYALGSATAGDPFLTVELRNATIHGSVAKGKGGALFLKNAVDLRLVKWGAGQCTLSGGPWPCVDVFSNRADNESFSTIVGAGGAAFLEHDPGASRPALRVAGALFESNQDPNGTAAVVDARGDSSVRILRSVFIANSAGGSEAFRAMIESRNDTLFAYNTVLTNAVTHLFYQGGSTEINAIGSILYSPGATILGAGSLSHSGCLLAHSATGLPAGGLQVGPPNLDSGWAPRPRSRAIDNCDVPIGDVFYSNAIDAYGLPVPVDVPSIPNHPWGSYDLGAIEQRDVLFYNGFGTRPNH